MEEYNLIIIGGGAGAFAAAIKANELGAKTLMVNHGLPLGGTCVNVGCIPSKNLLRAGEVLYYSQNHNFGGIKLRVDEFDFGKTIQEELDIVAAMRKEKYEDVLKNLQNVTFIEGRAKFISPTEIEVSNQKYQGKKFVIATGSTANVPAISGIKEVGYLTHIEALANKKQPKSLVIIGAGPLGLEFAQMFHHFGTKVTVLQRGNTILPRVEPEIADTLQKYLTEEGIAGKTANTKDLNLQVAGIEIDERQAIKVNEYQKTTQDHIFAVGDVTNQKLRLETIAGREGTLAAKNTLTESRDGVNYRQVPYAVFTYPAVAGIGMTDAEVIESGGRCNCKTIDFSKVPKAGAIKDTRGAIKMVINSENRKILGIHMVAPEAADIINQGIYILKGGVTVDDVIDSLPVFPTLSEAIKIAALSFTTDITKLSCCV
ncbi:MAG: mercuric reductase, mercuric reductase [Candidatus Gottesmanbacteria bacterium GW2011_GWA2_43_14]|uniref:Mercuric reductase, mercuric reductase n=1 Tax=Candidatus Gottesmanbacteria bacterium GW2011_GWA2_43_14 TaxID=1618443 RepID=A0A0G1FSS2_9BACT|nr:MAG: mercuric reductase, mercuric reductase [Candidatus Gottesmanbacteria bacterium GW2011_GWA2_43_14]